jgi:hypothetical protein
VERIPVVLVVYKRVHGLANIINRLRSIKAEPMLVFADGPVDSSEIDDITTVDEVLNTIDWTMPSLYKRSNNIGLAENITTAVDTALADYGSCIVLEDDIDLSEDALWWMKEIINMYRGDDKVASVTAWTNKEIHTTDDPIYFDRRAESWAWATWDGEWQKHRDRNINDIWAECIDKAINISEIGPDILNQLVDYNKNNRSMWAIKWIMHCLCEGKLTIRPKETLCRNTESMFNTNATFLNLDDDFWYKPSVPCGKIEPTPANTMLGWHRFISRERASMTLKKLKGV